MLVIYVNLPMMLTVFLLALTHACAISQAMHNKSVGRKSYALILNRVAADLVFSLGAMAMQMNDWLSRKYMVSEVLFVTNWASFYAAMVTYLALAFLKLFAIFKPLEYRKHVTVGRILRLIAVSWTLYAMALTAVLIAKSALCAQEGVPWFNCRFYLSRVKNMANVVIYFSAILLFALTGMDLP